MVVIGLSGKAGAGKDFLADLMVEHRGFKKLAFADALKQDGIALMNFTPEEVYLTKPPHVRKWLQEYGVSRRAEDPEYWIKRLIQKAYKARYPRLVVTDVRFPNECVACLLMGRGAVVRVEHGDRPYPLEGTPAALHASETALDDYPGFLYRVRNGAAVTSAQLLEQIDPVIDMLTP